MEIKASGFCSMMMMIMFSCFLGIIDASAFNVAGVDGWMIPLFGMIFGIPILLIYLYIYNYKKEFNLNELNVYLFGNNLGKFFNLILLLFSISFTMLTFYNLTSFVASQYLYNTPIWFIDILFIFTTLYFFSKNETTIFRASLIFSYIVLLFYFVSCIGLIDKIDINNIKPILNHGISPVLKGVFSYITYTVLPIFTLSIVNRGKVDNNYLTKWIIITYFISHFLIFFCLFLLISVFGINLAELYQYPTYHILKRVFVGGFIERLENVLSIQYLIVLFIPCTFCNFYSFKSIQNIFSFKKSYIYLFLMIIMFLSQFVFKNNTRAEFFLTNIYPFIIGFVLITIPLIIFIKILYKKRTKTSSIF